MSWLKNKTVVTRPTTTVLPWTEVHTVAAQTDRDPEFGQTKKPKQMVHQGSQTEDVMVLSRQDQDVLLEGTDDPLPILCL